MKQVIYIEREYECDDCGKFVVIHSDHEKKSRICAYCANKIKETGITHELEGEWVIKKNWGKEISKRPAVKR